MKKNKNGLIINLASIASSVGISDRFAYSMTKGAVLTMTYSIAKDYVKNNVRCNAISPGGVFNNQPEEFVRRLSELIPLGRMAKKHEYHSAIQFLCSDSSSYMNRRTQLRSVEEPRAQGATRSAQKASAMGALHNILQ